MTTAAPRVLLVGVTGSGSSVVGAALATRAGWPFVDASTLILRATGRAPEQVAADLGEPALRRAELDALTMLLGLPGPYVAALPVGAVLAPAGRDRLAGAEVHVVWLRASISTLVSRTGASLGPEAPQILQAARAASDPVLAEVADTVVDVDRQTPAQVVRAVLRALEP